MHQDAQSAAYSSTDEEVWTVKQEAIKAEINGTLQFASHNVPFSPAESLEMCYQQKFLDSIISKNVAIDPNRISCVVAYGLRPYFTDVTIRELMEGQFISHYTLMKQ